MNPRILSFLAILIAPHAFAVPPPEGSFAIIQYGPTYHVISLHTAGGRAERLVPYNQQGGPSPLTRMSFLSPYHHPGLAYSLPGHVLLLHDRGMTREETRAWGRYDAESMIFVDNRNRLRTMNERGTIEAFALVPASFGAVDHVERVGRRRLVLGAGTNVALFRFPQDARGRVSVVGRVHDLMDLLLPFFETDDLDMLEIDWENTVANREGFWFTGKLSPTRRFYAYLDMNAGRVLSAVMLDSPLVLFDITTGNRALAAHGEDYVSIGPTGEIVIEAAAYFSRTVLGRIFPSEPLVAHGTMIGFDHRRTAQPWLAGHHWPGLSTTPAAPVTTSQATARSVAPVTAEAQRAMLLEMWQFFAATTDLPLHQHDHINASELPVRLPVAWVAQLFNRTGLKHGIRLVPPTVWLGLGLEAFHADQLRVRIGWHQHPNPGTETIAVESLVALVSPDLCRMFVTSEGANAVAEEADPP